MGRQAVDFGDTGHIGNKAGADTTARADDIAIVERFSNDFLRQHIQIGEAVTDNIIKFAFQAGGDDRMQ